MGNRFSGKVLSVDLATQFGWASTEIKQGGTFPPRVYSATERFASRGASVDEVLGGAVKWIASRMQVDRPDVLVYERPIAHLYGGRTNANTAYLLIGLPAIFEGIAYRYGVKLHVAHPRDVRTWLLGRNPKRAEAKIAVKNMVERMIGRPVKDDNEADAVAQLFFSCVQLDNELAAQADVHIMKQGLRS